MGVAAVLETAVSAVNDLSGAYDDAAVEADLPPDSRLQSLLVRSLALLVSSGYSVFSEALFGGIAIVIASDIVLGRHVEIARAGRQATRSIVRLVLAVGLSWLAVLILLVTILGIPFAMYVMLGWLLAGQVVLLDDARGLDALRRSWRMVSGRRWHVLACVALIALVEAILYNVPACIVLHSIGVGDVLRVCFPVEPVPMPLRVVDWVVRGLSAALVHALPFIVTTLLYYDLRVADEGFDLDLRAAVLDRQPAA
jgi:hypothetical protein